VVREETSRNYPGDGIRFGKILKERPYVVTKEVEETQLVERNIKKCQERRRENSAVP